MQAYVLEAPRLEEWLRTSFVDDNGQIYLPCGAFGNESEAQLCLIYDNVKHLCDDGHIYAPTSWLIKQYPKYTYCIHQIFTEIKKRISNIAEACHNGSFNGSFLS